LDFPLRGGNYLVVNGGRSESVNAHLATLKGDKLRPWRGQSFGVDIVKIDKWGLRAEGVLPADPARYAIFGEEIYSPCGGEVITAVDGVADMPPPTPDRQHMAGNHVILQCGGIWVLLGHMQRGSVRLHPGEEGSVGQVIGRVGNTGNTGEPHLHIHAQRPGTASAPISGAPLPIRLGKRYPVRNARYSIDVPAPGAGAARAGR
jgi:murein DD-endopeptidase MepM/ murein hydrolase activator NlpD